MPERRAIEILISGLVQGVGFRPFVYRMANEEEIRGTVSNGSRGVLIHCEGSAESLDRMIQRLHHEHPPMAIIDSIHIRDVPHCGAKDFCIITSHDDGELNLTVSPDIGICPDCATELFDSRDLRFSYPFINCVNCGPRFSIIRDLPYDRTQTSMAQFPLCEDCAGHYHDPSNRRFHAQPVACARCGPMVRLIEPGEPDRQCTGTEALERVRTLLRNGAIVAIKGLGGYHLACDATREAIVALLRVRKKRPDKPFAVMAESLERIREFCHVSTEEAQILQSVQSPILLLAKRDPFPLAPSLSPRNGRLGVMLPYTPLHRLLLHNIDNSCSVLVMTSGNLSGRPILFDDTSALSELTLLSDAILTHDRDIVNPCDDTVALVSSSLVIRQRFGRGEAPYEFKVSNRLPSALACGAEQKSSIALSAGKRIVVGQYLCDLKSVESLEHVERARDNLLRLFRISPELVVHDMHPDYVSTHAALEMPARKHIAVQHHHAHLASCLLENRSHGKAIGVCFDGTGYGEDGTVWGGEILLGDCSEFRRIARCGLLPMPGGEQAIRQPWRMAVAWLWRNDPTLVMDRARHFFPNLDGGMLEGLISILEHGTCITTSSVGRLFDIAGALLAHRDEVSYEGQGALELQYLAEHSSRERTMIVPYTIESNGLLELDPSSLFEPILYGMRQGKDPADLAFGFHQALVIWIMTVCVSTREKYDINTVALSGGVFQNDLLRNLSREALLAGGFTVQEQRKIPCNDGGIAFGQLAVALTREGYDLMKE